MKKSNLTLSILLMSIFFILLIFGFKSPLQKENNRRFASSSWLEAKGVELSDTIIGNYHHLVCGFPLTSLDARLANTLIVKGSKNAIPFASARIKNDTLYLDYVDHNPQYKVADNKVNGRYPIHLIVGSKNLRSIHVKASGNIIVDATSLGYNKDEPVYDSIGHIKNFQTFDEIDISLNNSARLFLFMHAKKVNLSTDRFMGSFNFEGHIRNLQFKYPHGNFRFGVSTINVDSAFIYNNDAVEDNNSGRLNFKCAQYLYAELHADMDIYYKGNPMIEKIESDYGRVINWNSKPKTEEPQQESNAEVRIEENDKEKRIKHDSTRFIFRQDSISSIRNTPDQLIKIPI